MSVNSISHVELPLDHAFCRLRIHVCAVYTYREIVMVMHGS